VLRSSLRILLWFACLAALGGYLFLAFRELRHPRPVDPSESAILVHAEQLVSGRPLPAEPTSLAAPPVLPGFLFALAPLVGALGPRPWEPRVISALALLACAVLILRIIQRETSSYTLAAVGAGVLLLASALLAAPAARGQTEAFALLLVLLAFQGIRHVGEIWGGVLGALLLSAACFTDATALPFLIVALVHCCVRSTRSFAAFTLGTAAFLGGGYYVMSSMLGPWFDAQVSGAMLDSFRFDGLGLIHLLGGQFLGTFGVLTLTVVLSFGLPVRPWQGAVGLWTWFAIGGLLAAAFATQCRVIESHALLPAMLAVALAGPLAMQRVTRHLSAWPGATRFGGESMVLTALALQFLQLVASAPALFAR